ncbi:MAG TPA: mannitol dehydrogenase family protein [Caldimonas sp.]|nr:mannitol dehydrogenase family protein [Caldimonas sp.]HEX2541621.1 mannitol dehydrogenase family protein [Caldimonas sp.]
MATSEVGGQERVRDEPCLSPALLRRLRPGVRHPAFAPQALRPGILHLGCGAFHRAHQALITQHAIEAELASSTRKDRLPPWGIVSTSLRSPDTVHALKPQGGLYSVLERGADRTRTQVVGTLCHLAFVPEERETLAACFSHAAIRIVTLTVSVTGYCIDATSHRLDPSRPEIQRDLRSDYPCSTVGVLVQGLAQRRAAGLPPPVVLSCDNLSRNGDVVRRACIDYAALSDDGLAQWIAANVQFPNTVVDRIVPAVTEADRADAFDALGVADAAPVSAEPYRQWVIERFDGPRPRWDAAGAEFVADVGAWEASKLRLLNGGHLALAYLGLLGGFDTVDRAIADSRMLAFVRRFMLDEQCPTLPPSGHDVMAYAAQLVHRWRNPNIADSLLRVGRDGSAKLPARLLASLRDNLQAQRPAPCTVLAVAAWMQCAAGPGSARPAGGLQDPLSDALQRVGVMAGDDPQRLVDGLLALPEIFGDDLPSHPLLRRDLCRAVDALQRHGVPGAIAACLSPYGA